MATNNRWTGFHRLSNTVHPFPSFASSSSPSSSSSSSSPLTSAISKYKSKSSSVTTLFTCLLFLCQGVMIQADTNRFYHVSKLCVRDRNFPLYKKIDGAVIESESETDLDCVLTFQTDSILQRFMLRFESLALDCNDHLYIYDGAHAFGHYKADLSCRSTRSEIGTIFTQSNFLTLKYSTDRYSKPGDGFKLVITAFKDTPSIGCSQLKCRNTFCISKDLACDTVNHCGDNSDETSHAFCYTANQLDPISSILGIEFNIFMAIILSIFVICLVCVVNLAVCLCRSSSNNNGLNQQHRIALHGQSTTHLAHLASYAGVGAPLNQGSVGTPLNQALTRYATLPLDKGGNKIPSSYQNTGIYGQLNGGAAQYVSSSISNNHVGHVMVTDAMGVNGLGMIPGQQQLAPLNGVELNGMHQVQPINGSLNGMNGGLNGMIPLQQVVYYTPNE